MEQVCAIWGTPAEVGPVTARARPTYGIDSPRVGGVYFIALGLKSSLDTLDARAKARLTTWLVNQHRAGVRHPEVTDAEIESAAGGRPMGYADKVERFFLCLDRQGFTVGDEVNLAADIEPNHTLQDEIWSWCECASEVDFDAFLNLLQAECLIEPDVLGIYLLTATGFGRLEEVTRRHPSARNAFVAMWFSESMTPAFEEGIAPALADAGYMPVRVDRLHHEGKIDDEIIAQIRQARFVVADFTCGIVPGEDGPQAIPRGGVYYEAGFAQGLGIPVIWSVRQDQINAVHFDTRQFPHITWTTPAELRGALYNRVAALIGIAKVA